MYERSVKTNVVSLIPSDLTIELYSSYQNKQTNLRIPNLVLNIVSFFLNCKNSCQNDHKSLRISNLAIGIVLLLTYTVLPLTDGMHSHLL